jgi:hypothetical protein
MSRATFRSLHTELQFGILLGELCIPFGSTSNRHPSPPGKKIRADGLQTAVCAAPSGSTTRGRRCNPTLAARRRCCGFAFAGLGRPAPSSITRSAQVPGAPALRLWLRKRKECQDHMRRAGLFNFTAIQRRRKPREQMFRRKLSPETPAPATRDQMKISPGVLTACLLLSSTSVLVLSLWYCFSARHNLIGQYEWDWRAIKQCSDSTSLAQRS